MRAHFCSKKVGTHFLCQPPWLPLLFDILLADNVIVSFIVKIERKAKTKGGQKIDSKNLATV